jgi:hypothetical protein
MNNPIKKLIFIFLFFILFKDLSFAQNSVGVEFGLGPSIVLPSNSILPYWDRGIKITGGISYDILQDVQIFTNLRYARFRYIGGYPLILPAVYGIYARATGNASKVYEALLGVRFITPRYFVRPFVSISGGIQSVYVGEIFVTRGFKTELRQEPEITYLVESTGKTKHREFVCISYGLLVSLHPSIKLLIDGSFSQSFDLKRPFYQLLGTVQFKLNK